MNAALRTRAARIALLAALATGLATPVAHLMLTQPPAYGQLADSAPAAAVATPTPTPTASQEGDTPWG